MGYRKEVMDWLLKQSDRNLLRHYRNKLKNIPAYKRKRLSEKKYIKEDEGKIRLTEKGEELLREETVFPQI
jgi:predicted methyltransferase